MDTTDHKPAHKPFTGHHMLAIVCTFFAIIIIANGTMAYYATSSWTGLVVKNSYVASQKYNAHLQSARDQLEIGWTSRLEYDSSRLNFDLQDRSGNAISSAQVSARLERPVGTFEDVEITLIETVPGTYRSKTTLGSGAWNATVIARQAGKPDYTQIFRLSVGNDP